MLKSRARQPVILFRTGREYIARAATTTTHLEPGPLSSPSQVPDSSTSRIVQALHTSKQSSTSVSPPTVTGEQPLSPRPLSSSLLGTLSASPPAPKHHVRQTTTNPKPRRAPTKTKSARPSRGQGARVTTTATAPASRYPTDAGV